MRFAVLLDACPVGGGVVTPGAERTFQKEPISNQGERLLSFFYWAALIAAFYGVAIFCYRAHPLWYASALILLISLAAWGVSHEIGLERMHIQTREGGEHFFIESLYYLAFAVLYLLSGLARLVMWLVGKQRPQARLK